jgi:peptidyl-prolyl cis-trans isomerase B (cyclophilin B)
MSQAVFETTKGVIVLDLFDQDTPATVKNFVELVNKGFYNGLKFHRVIDNFMVQGGCPQGTGTGGPGYNIECEIRPNLKHQTGSLAMAHAGSCAHDSATGQKTSGECSNGSQFYITHRPTSHLDGIHTVFGQVVQGQEVVNAIRQGDMINKITIQ